MGFMPSTKGVTFAAALLVIFIVVLVGFLAYMAVSTPPVQKTYFENLGFTIEPHKEWHVGVPVAFDGDLRLSFTTDFPVRVSVQYGETYLLDQTTQGPKEFTMGVSSGMGVLDLVIVNLTNATVTVAGATCTLTT